MESPNHLQKAAKLLIIYMEGCSGLAIQPTNNYFSNLKSPPKFEIVQVE